MGFSGTETKAGGDVTVNDEVRGNARSGFVNWWLPSLLLLLFVCQSLWFIGTQSLTFDEPGHIFAGVDAWQHGRFEMWVDHPPLGRFWLTLLIARSHVEIVQQSPDAHYRVTAMNPGPEWLAWRTRPMNLLLGILLGIAVWSWTRRLFSAGAANIALALFAFTPSLIAHYSVATTDGIGALFIFLTAGQVVLWTRNPCRRQALLMGVVLGGLLLAKLYTPPIMLLALLLMLVLGRNGILKPPRNWNWKPTIASFVIASFILCAGYLFHVSHLSVRDGQLVMTFPNRPARILPTQSAARLNLLVPAGEYLEGLRLVWVSNRVGRPTWFLGKQYPNGAPRTYFPVVILLKWPTILLLLFFSSLFLGVRKTCRAPGDLLVISLFPLLFLALTLQSHITIGERHVLPLYPFALLIAGGIWEHARRHRATIAIVALALCLNAADALRYAPDYLAYFNAFVAPENRWRLSADGNLDWGQGLIALRAYQQAHPDDLQHIAYFGSVAPELYGVRTSLEPNESLKGTVIVSPSCLAGGPCGNYDSLSWLQAYKPRQLVDHCLWVFDVGR